MVTSTQWVINYLNPKTRYNIPNLNSHMISSHDLCWLWQEELHIPPGERFGFWIRLVRFIILQCLLLGCLAFLFGNRGEYFISECDRRAKCKTWCNEDYFPEIVCTEASGVSFEYKGNNYDQLYWFPSIETSGYQKCMDYISENEDYDDSQEDSSRQERLHTCFVGCQAEEDGFKDDNRPACSDQYPQSTLLCIDPDDDCEEVYIPNEVEMGSGLSFDAGYVWIAIFISNGLQYLYQWLVIYTIKVRADDIDNLKSTSYKCSLQILVTIISTVIVLVVGWRAALVNIYGPGGAMWGSFIIALLFDQTKSVLFHLAVWYFLIRRCGYLKPNEAEYVDIEWHKQKKDTTWDYFRSECSKVIESKVYEAGSIIFLCIYAVFVLIALSLSTLINNDEVLDIIDQSFLCVFILEILLQVFVNGFSYFADWFNSFDATIVSVSFVMFFIEGIESRGLAALRLLRLARLVIVLRKVSSSKRKSKGEFNTALEEVIFILNQVKQIKKLPLKVKKELVWAIDLIESNKLYEVSMAVSSDKGSGPNAQDLEARKWISLATPNANDPMEWFDRDLDDFLFERQRGKEGDIEYKDIHEEYFRKMLTLHERTFVILEKISDDFIKWRFNAFQYYELCQRQMITHFLGHLFQEYQINIKFEVNETVLKEFTLEIFDGYQNTNPYHNAIHAVDVTHRLNFFIKTGNLIKYISDLDIMAALTAGIIHDYQHPGVNNDFLIKSQHKKSIRYNDISVLEKHHLAAAFAVLLDSNFDITMALHEDQYWVFRTTVVKMVLATDIKKQEEVLNAFNNNRGIPNFPNNDKEKNTLLNMALRVADHGNPLQPHDLYFKWMACQMEEFYQQGDIEKYKGMELSAPFMDRTVTNPYSVQLGYIEVVVEPLVNSWVSFIPEIKEDLVLRGLNENKELLKQKEQETIEDPQDESFDQPQDRKRRGGNMESGMAPINHVSDNS